MARLILRISVSIDGFLEASSGKLDFAKSRSPEGAALVAERMAQAGAHLLGRKAFCEMASFWPAASGPNAKAMNEIPKIVFSRKGFDPAQATGAKGWADAQVATGDLAEAIAKLKERSGKDLMAHGGIEFARNLVQTGLVDEYCMAVHPVAAGAGYGLFEKLGKPLYLKLIESKVFPTGAMLNTFRPE
jgi:dihydrofolate reductase